MFPFITIGGTKVYMTGIGILVSMATFIIFAAYFCKKYKQNFWKLFYRLPILIVLVYLLGSYISFVLQIGWFPESYEELLTLLSPYGFNFHFVGILIGIVLAMIHFFKRVQRYENKKVWIDIMFYSVATAILPLGFFLLLGDDFIGSATSGAIGVKALHAESQLNKFSGVYPIGLMLSMASLLTMLLITIIRTVRKQFGYGLWGFIILLISLNIIFFVQQYPKYGIVSIGGVTLDIKHQVSFLVIMFCLWTYYKWKKMS